MTSIVVPNYIPTNINGNSFNATAIIVWWDPVPNTRMEMMGQVMGFQVKYPEAKIVVTVSQH